MNIQSLARRIHGAVLEPGAEGYDVARAIWNGRLERRPAAIVRPRREDDIVATVNFARDNSLLLSVKSGGHDYAGKGTCDDGVMLDLSTMTGVSVDPEERIARVQPGATWGMFDQGAQAFGLATTGGTCSMAGVAGVALGGGTGYLARKYGLTVDNLSTAYIVTADGWQIRASEDENPDLFWGLRGGGANLGVVTTFEFRLHEVGPKVLAGQIVHRFEDAGKVLRCYRDFVAAAPDETTCYAFAFRVPPIPAFPVALHGAVVMDLVVCHIGPISEGEEVLRPLRHLGAPMLDTVAAQSYTALQRAFDDGLPAGERYYSKAHHLDALTDETIDTFVSHAEQLRGPYTVAYFGDQGGVVGRIAPASTAYPHRHAGYAFHLLTGWTDPAQDDELMGWAREFHEAMGRHSSCGVYVNLLAEDEEDRVGAAYGDNYGRLAELKNRWDPENLFRVNHNLGRLPN